MNSPRETTSTRPDAVLAGMLQELQPDVKLAIFEGLESPARAGAGHAAWMANAQDWEVEAAGQRVRIIRKDAVHGAILRFGAESVAAAGGALVAMPRPAPGPFTAAESSSELHRKIRASTAEFPRTNL